MSGEPRPLSRYQWLLDGLREHIHDVKLLVNDYGYTVYLASRSLQKRMPLMLGGFDDYEAWDFIDHFKIDDESRRAETIQQLVRDFRSDAIRASGSERPS